MNPQDPNVALVESVAKALAHLNNRVVFVGGCAVGLLISDDARPVVRATQDVDILVEIATRAAYYEFAEELRRIGFSEDHSASVICRWRLGKLQVDVMPTEKEIFGFSNRWALSAVRNASDIALPSGRSIQLISPPHLLATKLEAFFDRGNGDYAASHDIEDIVNLVDGRAELVEEVRRCETELREYLGDEIEGLLLEDRFVNALPWHLGPTDIEQGRVPAVIERLRKIAGI